MPTQDYKKQGLAKLQRYTVRAIDHEVRRLVVETTAGQLVEIDPAQCERKTVYRAQSLNIAVGDHLRWTKNDRAAKTRNGQQFTVDEISSAGNVRTMDETGQSRWFDLSEPQHVDYAWVSTTYSSQGKTADRVLALTGDKTTNRESFYVAVSRAKHGLKLYTADKQELLKRAQTSRAKENASDYVPLFKVVREYAETQKENLNSEDRNSTADGRDVGQFVGESFRERSAQELTADTLGHRRTQSANRVDGTGNAAVDGSLESVADILSEQLEPFSRAVAEYVEQSAFIECERFFAAAVAAAHRGSEQLADATENRGRVAATVERLDAAVTGKVERSRAEVVAKPISTEQTSPNDTDYEALWRFYQQDIQAHSEGELDYLVGRRAFRDGVGQKAIALMLASGSPMVQQLHRSYGKEQAMKYVNQIAYRICQRQIDSSVCRSLSKRQIELE